MKDVEGAKKITRKKKHTHREGGRERTRDRSSEGLVEVSGSADFLRANRALL